MGCWKLSNTPPILAGKDFAAPSVFEPENLLREARRQKNLPRLAIPGGLPARPRRRYRSALAKADGAAARPAGRATTPISTNSSRAATVSASSAAPSALPSRYCWPSSCSRRAAALLISMTSAGQIVEQGPPPYFILIDRALRDEGTSYHYLPPAEFAEADGSLVDAAMNAFAAARQPMHRGASWTTDAPFRETAADIERCRARNILAVEMEAAGALRLRQGAPQTGAVFCPCHQPDGGQRG